jgi:hypothetical protein
VQQRAAQREAHRGGGHMWRTGAQRCALLPVDCPPGSRLVLLACIAGHLAG